jgi:hypothetical protein
MCKAINCTNKSKACGDGEGCRWLSEEAALLLQDAANTANPVVVSVLQH